MHDPVEAYLKELRDVRATGAGVKETSYYHPLANLLNEVGKTLKPKVRAVSQLTNTGAGAPDFGLFTQSQFTHTRDVEPMAGQPPQRGVIEVKGTSDDVLDWSKWPDPEQVPRYVERYGLVLVTNLRDFVLVGRGPGGEPVLKESCRLSETETGFWTRADQPRKYAEEAGEGLIEFLKRVMLHSAPLLDPKDVAWFLASYARTARLRLEKRTLPALAQLREQLEEALGLKFEGEKGDHFFRSTLVQTLFYGMFASWVLWTREQTDTEDGQSGTFQWEMASSTLHVPMVSELFYQFANPNKLGPLGLAEVLKWAEEVLNRVDRAEFFSRFQRDHAVQYFYEPFLEAFDPQLRKELGVWYTPDEVVKYMVARVDWALREELDIADGLADPNVYVLDPCCGTGAYLVEVLRKIDETLTAKGADALTRQDVKRAAMERVIGFEIMPAPFVVAHLQLGLLLAELGVPLAQGTEAHERAAVYLTNALTGWGEGKEALPAKSKRKVFEGQLHSTLLLPEFAEERDAAGHVKRETPILVVLGNPPYNGFAGMAVEEERGLSDAYRTTTRAPKPQGQGLNDLYVRFFRLAERQVAERSGRGVVCYISNYSWLSGLSFTGMRERLFEAFDHIWIDNLHGDRIISEYAPDGRTSETVFAQGSKSPGIKVGTAIALLARTSRCGAPVSLKYADFDAARAEDRRQRLLGSLSHNADHYRDIRSEPDLGYPFVPASASRDYLKWPDANDLLPWSSPGIQTARDGFLVSIEEKPLHERIIRYLDPAVADSDVDRMAMLGSAGFDPVATRRHLTARGTSHGQFIRHQYRPMDVRWLYWEAETKLLDRARAGYVEGVGADTLQLVLSQGARRGFDPPMVSKLHIARHLIERGANAFPSSCGQTPASQPGVVNEQKKANLSAEAAVYLDLVRAPGNAEQLMRHIIAITHAPAYGGENRFLLDSGWPRVPMPADERVFDVSAQLGNRVAALLLGESRGSQLPLVGSLCALGRKNLDPAVDLAVTAR